MSLSKRQTQTMCPRNPGVFHKHSAAVKACEVSLGPGHASVAVNLSALAAVLQELVRANYVLNSVLHVGVAAMSTLLWEPVFACLLLMEGN